jgi:hypothetical protein
MDRSWWCIKLVIQACRPESSRFSSVVVHEKAGVPQKTRNTRYNACEMLDAGTHKKDGRQELQVAGPRTVILYSNCNYTTENFLHICGGHFNSYSEFVNKNVTDTCSLNI